MMVAMSFRAGLSIAIAVVGLACKVKDPLYCDQNTPCMDADRPFCDLEGEYPASDGIKKTCIPDPFSGTDGGVSFDAATERTVQHLATAASRSCAVLSDGALRCWGSVDGDIIGDNELPREAGDLETGGPVAQVVIALIGTCIRYEAGNVRCWGDNTFGELGYGHKRPVEGPPSQLPDVDLGGPAAFLTAGENFFCALLESGDVRCWGYNPSGQLGLGNTVTVGDNEVPS